MADYLTTAVRTGEEGKNFYKKIIILELRMYILN